MWHVCMSEAAPAYLRALVEQGEAQMPIKAVPAKPSLSKMSDR